MDLTLTLIMERLWLYLTCVVAHLMMQNVYLKAKDSVQEIVPDSEN